MTSSPYVLYKKWLLLRVISIRRCTPAGFKLTKLFGIDDFSVAKDFGKVFIIIIYCFYNYYYLFTRLNSFGAKVDVRDFKIHYGEALLRLPWPERSRESTSRQSCQI